MSDPEVIYESYGNKLIGAGATGGGGHSIIDSEGETMSQEDAMQFPDSFVSDDSTNGRTVVENIKEVLPADYDSTTDEGIIVCDDGNDVPIGEIEEDSVSVTADGVKTWGALFAELHALIDSSKMSSKAKLQIGEYRATYVLRDVSADYYLFSLSAYYSAHAFITNVYRITPNASSARILEFNCSTTGITTNGDISGTGVPTSGTVISLHYGTSSGIVELNTDARHCMMPDGETSVNEAIGAIKGVNSATFSGNTDANGNCIISSSRSVLNARIEASGNYTSYVFYYAPTATWYIHVMDVSGNKQSGVSVYGTYYYTD